MGSSGQDSFIFGYIFHHLQTCYRKWWFFITDRHFFVTHRPVKEVMMLHYRLALFVTHRLTIAITAHQLFHRLGNQLGSSTQTHNTATHVLTDHLHHTSSFLQLPLSIILKNRFHVHYKHQHHFLCGCGCCLSAGVSWGGTSWWWCRMGGVVRIHCRAAPVRNANPPLTLQKCPALVWSDLCWFLASLKRGC